MTMRLDRLTVKSRDALAGAEAKARRCSNQEVTSLHLLSTMLDQEDGLTAPLLEQAGIDLNRPTASHCNGGGRASVMAFGLELMGAEDVRNYYRGWGEWGNSKDTPVIVREKTGQKQR